MMTQAQKLDLVDWLAILIFVAGIVGAIYSLLEKLG